MNRERITHMIHHADPNVDRGSKRETVIKHQKSATPVSVYQISGLALELSRQADGTIGPEFEHNCERAFEMLTKYQGKLNALQEDNTE